MGKYLTSSSNFRGVRRDLAARSKYYWDDWTSGHNAKTTASIFFMFFTSVAPAITFAGLLQKETDQIGVIEVCVSSAVTGMIFSVFAGQPLVILGVTGPVSILTIAIYNMTDALGIKFLPFYAWSQFFAAAMHIAIAGLGLCDYIKYITNFSCHTFGLLIALIYAVTGISGIVSYFLRDQDFESALMETVVALGTVLTALYFAEARTWTILNEKARVFISDYAPTMAIVLWTGLSLVGRAKAAHVKRIDVPSHFRTLNGRSWIVNPFHEDCPGWAIILAIVPALIITVLFIFDHNVSSIMAQTKDFKLKKGSAYHLDFLVLGCNIAVTGLLGIPPTNGLIPQAPLHTKSLCVLSRTVKHGVEIEVVDKVYEQRYTNFFQAFLTGLVCFKPFISIIGRIPIGCLDGLFVFMALSSLPGNELYERLCLVASEARLRRSAHDFFRTVDFAKIRKFTYIQLVAACVVYVVTLTPIALTFPLFIAALVYIRLKALPKFFDSEALDNLDPLIDLDIDNTADEPPANNTDDDDDGKQADEAEQGALQRRPSVGINVSQVNVNDAGAKEKKNKNNGVVPDDNTRAARDGDS